VNEKTPTENYQLLMQFTKNRESAAYTYSRMLREPEGAVDIGEVERTMLTRWSESGVNHIRRLARRRHL